MMPYVEKITSLLARNRQEADVAARIDELKKLKRNHSETHITKQEITSVYDSIPAKSILAMVPLVHINDRLDELAALESTQGEEA